MSSDNFIGLIIAIVIFIGIGRWILGLHNLQKIHGELIEIRKLLEDLNENQGGNGGNGKIPYG
jgi:hypothetical protein